MHSILRKSLAAVALPATALGVLATPVLAKSPSADLGVSAGINVGSGSTAGVGAGLGAGSGGAGLGAGAVSGGGSAATDVDGQIATPAPLNLQPAAPELPAGLDRFSIQSNGPANVSIFYRVIKTKF